MVTFVLTREFIWLQLYCQGSTFDYNVGHQQLTQGLMMFEIIYQAKLECCFYD